MKIPVRNIESLPWSAIPFGIMGGSGAYKLLSEGALGKEAGCVVLQTPFGNSNPVHRYDLDGLEYIFISRHGEKDYSMTAPFVNYRANIYALKASGVERVISWSGPGIIDTAFKPGEFVVPHDIIDETRNRESTFFKNRGVGFIRQNEPFCPHIRLALHNSLHSGNYAHHEQAVYVCTEGPRLETPAEIRKMRILGGQLVGMTLAPESFLARELELCYAPICYLTNYAEGVMTREFVGGELFEGMQTDRERGRVELAMEKFPHILADAFAALAGFERTCQCKDALRRYKNKGMIGEDWRSWFEDK